MSFSLASSLAHAMAGLVCLAVALPVSAVAAEGTTRTSSAQETIASDAPATAAPPLRLDLTPLTSGLLKLDPVVPYLPQIAAKPIVGAKNDPTKQPLLTPVLRESVLPDSLGDRGTFFERHEFGIQLRDRF